MECVKCGDIQKGFHDYNGGCKCVRCGKTASDFGLHKFMPVEGKCIRVCEICGKTEYLSHIWDGCKCKRCGAPKDKDHEYVFAGSIPQYGRCPTLDLTDQYVCNFCDEKDCKHVELSSKYSYICEKCGHSVYLDYKETCGKERVLYHGSYYREK